MSEYSNDFLEFWKEYKHKAEKKYAAKCYQKAIKEGAIPLEILEGVKRYNAWLASGDWRPNPKNPSTFLNKGCWEDEYENPNDKKPIEFNLSAEHVKKLTGCGIAPDAVKRWFDDAVFMDAAIIFKKEFMRDYVSRNFDGPLRRVFGFMPELVLSGSEKIKPQGPVVGTSCGR